MVISGAQSVKGGSFLFHPAGSLPQFTPEESGEEALAIAEAARDFVDGEVMPRDEAIDHLDLDLTRDLLRKAGELGILGIEIPEAYGGLDLEKKTALLVLEQMARQASFSTSYGAHTSIGTLPIVYFGNAAQKAKYLPKLATGEWLAAYALTEAGSGSDALGAKTTAVLEDGHWVLNGTKAWITNAGFADVFVVFAKINGTHFSAFIVERTDPGLGTGAEEKKMGIKGSSTRTLVLDNCRIPEDRLLGGKGKGARIAFGILNVGRFKLGASSVGAGKRVLEYTLKYAGERHQFGKPLTAFGLIQQKLADMAVRIFVGESMNFRTIGYLDDALAQTSWDSETGGADKMKAIEEFAIEASMAKVWGSEALWATADDAVQSFGGAGFSAEYPAEKIYRDCRINRIFEGTNEINRLLIAGTFLKRCSGADGLPLAEAVTPLSRPEDPALDLAEGIKAQVRTLAALVQREQGPKILDNQEAAARLSNLLMEAYATESAAIRAARMAAAGHRWAGLAQDLALVQAQESWNRVQAQGPMLAAEVAQGDALDAILDRLRKAAPRPRPLSTLRSRIARVLTEQGRYPVTSL